MSFRRDMWEQSCTRVNGYGPTENTTFTCCYPVPMDYRVEGSLPIGVPMHTTVHILDAEA